VRWLGTGGWGNLGPMVHRNSRAWTIAGVVLLLVTGLARPGSGQTGSPSLTRKYAGAYTWDKLFEETRVRSELASLLGSELSHLKNNLFVAGSIDLLGGYLAISGNAAHRGGEEEAIACIAENPLAVHAAILTGGRIQVYSRAKGYDGLPICIMDWITQANSEHRDRFQKPSNVDLVPPRPPSS
jgi:hypothetical protein